ncbi:MAG: fimbria/pilus outer membrane usher protein [Syntrophales bacterium]|nr:fimbria/pilus outer membrane usher protein [Syntrophales bacterium]
MKEQDLSEMGVKLITGDRQLIDSQTYVSLRSISGIRFKFIEESLTLEIQAQPEMLGTKSTIDFTYTPKRAVQQPKGLSAFLNYSTSWNDSLASRGFFDFSAEIGLKAYDFLFLSNFTYRDLPLEERFVRLSSQLMWENKKKLLSITLGDFYATSGPLGSTLNMGGISITKNYSLNPYYVKSPTFDYSGYVTLPTEMWLYVNEVPIRKEKIEPGRYDLKSIPFVSGFNTMKVVLKDAFGRETVVSESVYYTDVLLKKGEHEFSYNIGSMRKNYGVESNSYGPEAFLFHHRYGISDAVTWGIRGEGSREVINGGLTSAFKPLPAIGVTETHLSFSRRFDDTGTSMYAGHSFSSEKISLGLSGRINSKEYYTLTGKGNARYESYISLGIKGLIPDNIVANFGRSWYFDGSTGSRFTITYSKNVTKHFYLTCSATRILEQTNDTQFFVNLIYYPWEKTNLSGSFSRDRYSTTGSLTLQKNPSMKSEDYSFRVTASSAHISGEEGKNSSSLNPYLQVNRRFGQCTAEYMGTWSRLRREQESYRLSFAGAVVYADGHGGLSIPVYDSFGIVKVGNIKDVTVKLNYQEAGKTDSRGISVLPYLKSNVDNYISIDDKKVPLHYSIKTVNQWINPGTRQGVFVPFDVIKTQAFMGKIIIREKNVSFPIENVNIKLRAHAQEHVIPVLNDGEFYFENIAPGLYEVEFLYKGNPARFTLRIPESEKFMVDMGVIEIEME